MRLIKKITALSLVACVATPVFAANSAAFSPDQVQQIQGIIHDYIIQNPQVLVEAGKNLQQQQMNQMQTKAVDVIHANAAQIFNNSSDIIVGNPNGKISLVEFYDYQCAHCRDTAPVVVELIKANPNLRVVYKELPIFGQYSTQAATASLAAYTINKAQYPAFHAALMAAPIPFDGNTIAKAAKQAGIDYAALQNEMQNKQYATDLKNNLDLAGKLLTPTIGFVATPAIVIGYTNTTSTTPVAFMPGAADQSTLQDMINQVQK